MTYKKRLASIVVLLVLAAQTVVVFAQQEVKPLPVAPDKSQQEIKPLPVATDKSQQEETIRIGSAVVQTEVIVTDKSGRRTPGLKAADFLVLDESKTQTVDYFTVIQGMRVLEKTGPEATAPPGEASKPDIPVSPLTIPYEGRHIALVFDDANLTSDNFLRARNAFAEYINTKLTPNDMIALISTSGALASLQQFTNDKQRLLSALYRLTAQASANERAHRPQQYMSPAEAIRIDAGDDRVLRDVVRRMQIEDPSVPKDEGSIADQSQPGQISATSKGGDRSPDSAMSTTLDARARAQARALVSETMQNTRNNIATLTSLFRGMADLPGRKIAVYLTESFITAGGTSEDITNLITQLIETARKSGVSVYALDAAGLRTSNLTASERVTASGAAIRNSDSRSVLSNQEEFSGAIALVSGTGGEFIANTNSIVNGLERAIEDSSTYYVVGFKATDLDNKFHRLTITIKNRPDLIVRTRKGYLAANSETIRGTEAELVQALIKSPVALLDLPVDLVTNAVPTPTGEQTVITGFHVGRNYLTLPAATAQDQTASYEIVAYVFAAGRDKPVAGIVRTVTLDLAKDTTIRATLKKDGFVYVPQPFTQLEPGIYQMRAVIREKTTGSVGSAYQFFEVPDSKDRKITTLSGVVVNEADQTAFDGANSFKPGIAMDVKFIIFNLPKNLTGIIQHVRLLDAQGNPLLDSDLPILPVAQGTDRWQSPQRTRFNLPLKRGRYALVVTLKDPKGKIDVERRTDLVIE